MKLNEIIEGIKGLNDIYVSEHYYVGEHHDISNKDVASFLDNYGYKFKDVDIESFEQLEDLFSDYFIEQADSDVPIYNSDIAEWFSDHWTAVNDYIDEFGIYEKDFNIMNTIQGAYCISYERDLRDALQFFYEKLNK